MLINNYYEERSREAIMTDSKGGDLVSRISRTYSRIAMGPIWLLSLDALWCRLWPVLMLSLSISMEHVAVTHIDAAQAQAQRTELLMLQAMRNGDTKKGEVSPQVDLLTDQIVTLHSDNFGPAQRLLTWQVLLAIVLVPTLWHVAERVLRTPADAAPQPLRARTRRRSSQPKLEMKMPETAQHPTERPVGTMERGASSEYPNI